MSGGADFSVAQIVLSQPCLVPEVAGCEVSSRSERCDSHSMAVTRLIQRDDSEGFSSLTVVVEVKETTADCNRSTSGSTLPLFNDHVHAISTFACSPELNSLGQLLLNEEPKWGLPQMNNRLL